MISDPHAPLLKTALKNSKEEYQMSKISNAQKDCNVITPKNINFIHDTTFYGTNLFN